MRTQVRRVVALVSAVTLGLSVQVLTPVSPAGATGTSAVAVAFTAASAVSTVAMDGTIPMQADVIDNTPECHFTGANCDTPTGTVEFTLSGPGGTETLGSATLIPVAHEHSTARTSMMHTVVTVPVGTYTYQAHYLGDTTFSPNHRTVTVTVTKALVPLSLTQNSESTMPGHSVQFTALFAGGDGRAPSPTGTIAFTDNGHSLGTVGIMPRSSLLSAHATLTTSALSGGKHAIAATYAGDGNYYLAKSATVTHTVLVVIKPCVLIKCSSASSAAPTTAGPTTASSTTASPPAGSTSEGNAAGDSGAGNIPTSSPASAPGGSGGNDGSDAGDSSPSSAAPASSDAGGPAGTETMTAAAGHSPNRGGGVPWPIAVLLLAGLAALAALLVVLLRRRRTVEPDPAD